MPKSIMMVFMLLPLNVLVVAVKSIPFAWGNAFYYASEGSEEGFEST
jgi:hypothetical protein